MDHGGADRPTGRRTLHRQQGPVRRPCDPDDVVKCLDGLYRQQRITLAHARILRIWGERQIAPSSAVAAERNDHGCGSKRWKNWIGRFVSKGIVA